jgi:hypothetical protein
MAYTPCWRLWETAKCVLVEPQTLLQCATANIKEPCAAKAGSPAGPVPGAAARDCG